MEMKHVQNLEVEFLLRKNFRGEYDSSNHVSIVDFESLMEEEMRREFLLDHD